MGQLCDVELHFFDAALHFADAFSGMLDAQDIIDDIVVANCRYQRQQAYQQERCQPNAAAISAHTTTKSERNYEALSPFFLWATPNVIKRTFKSTTQFAHQALGGIHQKVRYRFPFPALNVKRRNEAVATGTIYSDVPAINTGAGAAQIFIRRQTTVADAYPLKT